MVEKVYYSDEPNAIHIESHGSVVDIWIRKNIVLSDDVTNSADGENSTAWTADEAYMQLARIDCPSEEEINEDIHGWFDYAASWKLDERRSLSQLQADIDYLAAMCGVDLEG